ncbi:ABC transporter substrate-binding protein [Arenibaculum pallidiluteum]|uniref:ABC transporter substrate-binding protein n=1 Tax=Arenibaculum pallidiluteum TaxID=2812559 RepID=UPI001A97792D|nr:ABC transporter substrate-binding protein [Arenibaculum pallidiluteum]
MRKTIGTVLGAVGVSALLSTTALADDIRLGALATLEGPFAQSGLDGLRGVELALEKYNYTVAGKKITLVKESSNAKPDVAVAKTRKLIEQDKADIVVGPLSGGEGIAVKEYAKSVPDKTFVNGTSGAQDTTLRDPAPNFYRFTLDGAQWQAGLGSYAYQNKGYRNIAVIGEDYSFPYAQVMGFQAEYCTLGGKIAQKNWVPVGTKDFTSVIAKLPDNVDAVYVLLGGADAVNFLTQYYQSGGTAPLIGSSVTVDQTVLSSKGPFRQKVVGMLAAGPVADSNEDPKWVEFVNAYKKKFPDGLQSPSLFAHGYYVSTLAVLQALEQVKGDLSNDQKTFQAALAKTEVTTNSPTGPIKLDQNRQAIADNFVTEVAQKPDGTYYSQIVKVAKAVDQTLGMDRAKFLSLGPASRDNPPCN